MALITSSGALRSDITVFSVTGEISSLFLFFFLFRARVCLFPPPLELVTRAGNTRRVSASKALELSSGGERNHAVTLKYHTPLRENCLSDCHSARCSKKPVVHGPCLHDFIVIVIWLGLGSRRFLNTE